MKSCMKSERDKSLTKVRIIVSDPYATDDSSSDEELEVPKPHKIKRIVHEIYLRSQLPESSQVRCNAVKTSRKKYPRQSKNRVGVRVRQSKYPVGVRRRQSGNFSAEITNPITKAKKWLGTYETSEEAAKAYADMKVEYNTLISVKSQSLSSPASAPAPPPAHCGNADNLSKENLSLNKDAVASDDVTKEMSFNFDFSNLQIPDLSLLSAEENFMASGPDGGELDFDCFLMDDDSNNLLDEFSLLNKDINISGFENSASSELPDYDFKDMEMELGDLKVALWIN